MKKRIQIVSASIVVLVANQVNGAKLPKSVVLPPGVEVPDNFELPDGIVIPEGFVITQEMVDQYMKYMEARKNGEAAQAEEDLWFKELASSHANANLQMSV